MFRVSFVDSSFYRWWLTFRGWFVGRNRIDRFSRRVQRRHRRIHDSNGERSVFRNRGRILLYCLRSKQTQNIDINVALFLPPVDVGLILIVAARTCFTQGRMYPGRSVLLKTFILAAPWRRSSHVRGCSTSLKTQPDTYPSWERVGFPTFQEVMKRFKRWWCERINSC